MFNNGAVEFEPIIQQSEERNYCRNIPRQEYLHKQERPSDYVCITDFGASTDENYEANTKAVNGAIAYVSEKGGGTVLVPEGTFVCSTVVLRSDVTLFVEGVLKCIDCETNRKAEQNLSQGGTYNVASRTRKGFVYAENARNIAICGGGRIDGNGMSYCQKAKQPELLLPLEKWHLKSYIMGFRSRICFEKENSGRANLIELCDCENIRIENIELYETACWTCNIFQSNDILIKDVIINSNFHVANSDGFDLSCCQNAVIDHCFVATGDDGICIKADGDEDVENITVKNCKVMSLANCFKIGTTVYRNVRNVTVSDCEFFMDGTTGGYSGISVQSDCGGEVSDITVENVKMNGVTSCFLLWLGDRRGITPGKLENVTLRNIYAENISLPSAISGVLHEGEYFKVNNVVIDNVSTVYRDSEEEVYSREGGVGYEAMLEYPEITRLSSIYINSHEESPYWELPVYGLFVRDAENISIKDFYCIPRSCNNRKMTNYK